MRSTERARRGRSQRIIPRCSAASCAPPSELGGGVPSALSPVVVQNHALHRASSAGAFHYIKSRSYTVRGLSPTLHRLAYALKSISPPLPNLAMLLFLANPPHLGSAPQ